MTIDRRVFTRAIRDFDFDRAESRGRFRRAKAFDKIGLLVVDGYFVQLFLERFFKLLFGGSVGFGAFTAGLGSGL